MGTLIGTPQARASFQQQLYPAGIDLNRSEIHRCLGVWRANSGTSFRAGQPVMLNSAGEIVLSDATSVLGIAKWDKITQKRTVVTDFPVVFGTSGATKNLKPNITAAADVRVATAVQGGGTVYALTTDYTINTSNGTITHVGAGSIVVTATTYVTYSRTLTEDDLILEGKNFWQQLDYVTIQDLRIAVIEAPAQVFTSEYVTSSIYTLTGANSNIYANSSGLFTSVSSGGKLVGTCISIPTATDPWLGIDFRGQTLVNT